MSTYAVIMVPAVEGEQADAHWCDVCDQVKHTRVRLEPAETTGGATAVRLCGGCAEGLEEGDQVDALELEARRQRRRGSQEP